MVVNIVTDVKYICLITLTDNRRQRTFTAKSMSNNKEIYDVKFLVLEPCASSLHLRHRNAHFLVTLQRRPTKVV